LDESDEEEIETRQQMKILQKELHSLVTEKQAAEKQSQELKSELDTWRDEYNELKKHLLGQVTDFERNSEELERLRRELHDAQTATFTKQEEKEALQKDILSKESEIIR